MWERTAGMAAAPGGRRRDLLMGGGCRMVAIRSASKVAAGRVGLRLVSGKKTALPQDDKPENAEPRDAVKPARSRGPKPASEGSAAAVILWDDPVGTEANGDRES
jgi:hypothetical protein